MKQQTKLSQEQLQAGAQQTRPQPGREFASAEELLRFDAAQTTVPPKVAQRLKKSADRLSPAPRSWWKNLLGQ
jgi:hypothetical protein